MDGGVWWAIVRGVAQSRTTEQLNSGSSKSTKCGSRTVHPGMSCCLQSSPRGGHILHLGVEVTSKLSYITPTQWPPSNEQFQKQEEKLQRAPPPAHVLSGCFWNIPQCVSNE